MDMEFSQIYLDFQLSLIQTQIHLEYFHFNIICNVNHFAVASHEWEIHLTLIHYCISISIHLVK